MISAHQAEELNRAGAAHFEAALSETELVDLLSWSEEVDLARPGERIADLQSLGWLLDSGIAGKFARAAIGTHVRPVRAILFDKSASNNWSLGWHQDRTIAVDRRAEVPGFRNWNVKAGIHHVEPPFDFIERMVTARIHLDAVDEDNAPLLIAPGSHRLGRIPEARIEAVVRQCGETICLSEAGDIWLYRTAIIHASKRTNADRRRRVLQVDFSGDDPPDPLRWAV